MFRSCSPILVLPERSKFLLNHFSNEYGIFLVTDGNCDLQTKKIDSLCIKNWIAYQNIYISGCNSPRVDKPAVSIASEIPAINGIDPSKVVFFGDRIVDETFASLCGFWFVSVFSMQAGKGV